MPPAAGACGAGPSPGGWAGAARGHRQVSPDRHLHPLLRPLTGWVRLVCALTHRSGSFTFFMRSRKGEIFILKVINVNLTCCNLLSFLFYRVLNKHYPRLLKSWCSRDGWSKLTVL